MVNLQLLFYAELFGRNLKLEICKCLCISPYRIVSVYYSYLWINSFQWKMIWCWISTEVFKTSPRIINALVAISTCYKCQGTFYRRQNINSNAAPRNSAFFTGKNLRSVTSLSLKEQYVFFNFINFNLIKIVDVLNWQKMICSIKIQQMNIILLEIITDKIEMLNRYKFIFLFKK